MAGTRTSATTARRNARELLAARHAEQLAAMRADEDDLAAFVERQTDIEAADATMSGDLERATRQRHRELTSALAEFQACLDSGRGATATATAAADGKPDPGAAESGLDALGAALDAAARTYREAVLAAAARCAATTARARHRQGEALHGLHERGMSLSDIAASTELSTTRVSRLIKHRAAPDGASTAQDSTPAPPRVTSATANDITSVADNAPPATVANSPSRPASGPNDPESIDDPVV